MDTTTWPPLQQCMGGHCGQREACAHYHAPQRGQEPPAERLCPRGMPVPLTLAPMPRIVALRQAERRAA